MRLAGSAELFLSSAALLSCPGKGRRVTKQLSVTFFCALVAAACLLRPQPAWAQNPPAPSRVNPKAQELLDRAIRALGGPAFLGFKRLTTTGRIYAISDEATAGLAPFESAIEFPDKRRFSFGKKNPVILINDGDRAWELDRFGVTHQLPEQIRRWKLSTRYGLENLLRLRIHDPDVLVQDGGVDFVDNVPAWVVSIIETEGSEVKLFLNKQNFLPVRINYQGRNPQTKEWDEFADVYGDYQNIQGIQTPMHTARFLNGERISETFRRTAQYNPEYPADYFRAPGH